MEVAIVEEESFFSKWWKKVKTWFTEIPGHNIAWFLISGGLLFQFLRQQDHISFHEMVKYCTINLEQLQRGNLWGLVTSPFVHYRFDTFIFSSITLALTAK